MIFGSAVYFYGNSPAFAVFSTRQSTCFRVYSDSAKDPYEDMKVPVEVKDISKDCRYDEMITDFYKYIAGIKENPFTYEHEISVHKVLAEVCGGYNMFK